MKLLQLIFLLCFATSVVAEQRSQQNSRIRSDVSGVVIDNSFSVLARDFVAGFSQIWRNQGAQPNQSVTLDEDVSALRGNQITISSQREVLYRTTLNRRADNSESGRSAALDVIKRLRSLRNGSSGEDLAADEF